MKKQSACAVGHKVPHPTCMLRSYVCSYLVRRRRNWPGGSRRRPLFCSRQPCTSPDAAKEGRTWLVAAAILVRAAVCAVCLSPLHMRHHNGGSALGLPSRRESVAPSGGATCTATLDKMMLAFSADQTTHLSLSRTAPCRCVQRLQPCRLRRWLSLSFYRALSNPCSERMARLDFSLPQERTRGLLGLFAASFFFFRFLAHPVWRFACFVEVHHETMSRTKKKKRAA